MTWASGQERPREMKFLVDLEKHTYISEKAHQEIIDHAGLNPAGYDNYLKGWVKREGTIKLWVENIEDVVFRYWDQIKLAFRALLKEKLTQPQARAYAIVNRVERFAGVVQEFLTRKNKNTYFENQLGYVVHFFGEGKMPKGREVLMLVNYKLNGQRYLLAGTRGKLMTPAAANAKRIRVRWSNTYNGYHKARGSVELLTDRRLLTLI